MNVGSINNLDKYLTELFSRRKTAETEPDEAFVASLESRLEREYSRIYTQEKSGKLWFLRLLDLRMPWRRWALAPAVAMAVVLIGVFYRNSFREERELGRLGSAVADVESQIEMLDKESQELAWSDNEIIGEDLTELERM